MNNIIVTMVSPRRPTQNIDEIHSTLNIYLEKVAITDEEYKSLLNLIETAENHNDGIQQLNNIKL